MAHNPCAPAIYSTHIQQLHAVFFRTTGLFSVAKVANNSRIVIGGQLGNLLFGPVGVPIEDVNGTTNSS